MVSARFDPALTLFRAVSEPERLRARFAAWYVSKLLSCFKVVSLIFNFSFAINNSAVFNGAGSGGDGAFSSVCVSTETISFFVILPLLGLIFFNPRDLLTSRTASRTSCKARSSRMVSLLSICRQEQRGKHV